MAVESQIQEEVNMLQGLQSLIQTYEEIAASRMQKVKASVLNNREFLSNLYEIYQQVKYSYDKEIAKLEERAKKKNELGGFRRNGRTVSVFLSANTGLYGDIIWRTFKLFAKGVVGKDVDIVVVGRVGRSMVETAKKELGISTYVYFDLPDDASGTEDFAEVVSYIVDYENVIVYHGQFETMLSQVPVEESLTGELPEEEIQAAEEAMYIFEPELEEIVGFFESEIMASIFEQSLHESSLSKFAARMINLDRAVVNIGDELNHTKVEAQRAHHRSENKKQLGRMSSMALWSN